MIDPNDFDEYETEFTDRQRAEEVATGLEKAKRELADLKSAADNVAARMRALDDVVRAPAAVRRAALNEVATRLTAAGHYVAAGIVRNMISEGGRS